MPRELTEARKALGMTQTALARELGVAINTVNRWEHGERKLPNWLALCLYGIGQQKRPRVLIDPQTGRVL